MLPHSEKRFESSGEHTESVCGYVDVYVSESCTRACQSEVVLGSSIAVHVYSCVPVSIGTAM